MKYHLQSHDTFVTVDPTNGQTSDNLSDGSEISVRSAPNMQFDVTSDMLSSQTHTGDVASASQPLVVGRSPNNFKSKR